MRVAVMSGSKSRMWLLEEIDFGKKEGSGPRCEAEYSVGSTCGMHWREGRKIAWWWNYRSPSWYVIRSTWYNCNNYNLDRQTSIRASWCFASRRGRCQSPQGFIHFKCCIFCWSHRIVAGKDRGYRGWDYTPCAFRFFHYLWNYHFHRSIQPQKSPSSWSLLPLAVYLVFSWAWRNYFDCALSIVQAEQEEIRKSKAPGDPLTWEDTRRMQYSLQVGNFARKSKKISIHIKLILHSFILEMFISISMLLESLFPPNTCRHFGFSDFMERCKLACCRSFCFVSFCRESIRCERYIWNNDLLSLSPYECASVQISPHFV